MSNNIPNSVATIPKVSVKQLLSHIDVSLAINSPLYIHGASGIGKTAIIEEYCKGQSGANVIKITKEFMDLFLVALESVDFSGLPIVIDGKATFAPSKLLPIEGDSEYDDKMVVVLLDEIPLAQPSVQSACYKLLQEGRIGQNKLHHNVRFILAGNRVEDRGHHNKVPPALNNRCSHVELMVDVEAWCEYSIESQAVPLSLVAFIENNHGDLHASTWESTLFQNAIKKPAWPSNRAWTNAGVAAKYIEDNEVGDADNRDYLIQQRYEASVGPSSAAKYMAYHSICQDLPTCKDIVQGRALGGGKVALQQQYYIAISTIAYLDSMYDMKNNQDTSAQTALGHAYLYVKESCDMEMLATFCTLLFVQRGFSINFSSQSCGIKALTRDCLASGTLKDYVHSDENKWV